MNQFGIAGGQQLDPGQDSDADGLTDVFERLAQTDSGRADTDGDGLLDGYEVSTSRSDPLLIDSDLDGFTDAAELRFGGNPLGANPTGAAGLGSDPLGPDPLGSDPLGSDPVERAVRSTLPVISWIPDPAGAIRRARAAESSVGAALAARSGTCVAILPARP